MRISVLERLLVAERQRRRMGESGNFVPPIAKRYATTEEEGPWVTSLTRGTFTLTRPNPEGLVGQAFFECPFENEGEWLRELYRVIWETSTRVGWGNRCSSIEEATQRMRKTGLEPKTLVVPYMTLREVVGTDLSEDEADTVSLAKGCVAEVNGVKVLSAGNALPHGSAILAAAQTLVGHYTRIYDHVGATILRADRSVVLVGGDAVA